MFCYKTEREHAACSATRLRENTLHVFCYKTARLNKNTLLNCYRLSENTLHVLSYNLYKTTRHTKGKIMGRKQVKQTQNVSTLKDKTDTECVNTKGQNRHRMCQS